MYWGHETNNSINNQAPKHVVVIYVFSLCVIGLCNDFVNIMACKKTHWTYQKQYKTNEQTWEHIYQTYVVVNGVVKYCYFVCTQIILLLAKKTITNKHITQHKNKQTHKTNKRLYGHKQNINIKRNKPTQALDKNKITREKTKLNLKTQTHFLSN